MYEWFDDMKSLDIVFELCSGEDLYNLVYKHGAIEEKQAAIIFKQLLLSINYLHKHNICHRYSMNNTH